MRFTPGPGVGGHCIPVDPYYLSWRAREFDFVDRFVELAGDINLAMPRHVVDLVAEGSTIAAGRSRGPGSASRRRLQAGCPGRSQLPRRRDPRRHRRTWREVRYHDPHVARFRDADGSVHDGVALDDLLDWADAIVVVTGHTAVDWIALYERADLVSTP